MPTNLRGNFRSVFGILIFFLLVTPGCSFFFQTPTPAPTPSWAPLPIKSQEEFSQGNAGGESFQIMHRLVRSYYHPQTAYAIEDVAGPWRSDDGGMSWIKPQSRGLIATYGQSIEVDPVNPKKVLAMTYYPWIPTLDKYAGIYLSTDGAESFNLVNNYDDPDADGVGNSRSGFDWSRHRFNNVNLVYDPTSTAGGTQEASVWYAAYHGGALLRSSDGGQTWTEVFSLVNYQYIYQVALHPTDGKTIYLSTDQGLLKSTDQGSHFSPIGDLPLASIPVGFLAYSQKAVTSLAFNPVNPEEIWITLVGMITQDLSWAPWYSGVGLFKSLDGGLSFNQIRLTDDNFEGSAAGWEVNFNNVFYVYWHPLDKNKILLSCQNQSFSTDNGGATWYLLPPATAALGLGRENMLWRRTMIVAPMSFNPQNSSDILIHSSASFWKTLDGGRNIKESATGFTGMAWGMGKSTVAWDRVNPQRFAFFNHDVGMKITGNGGQWFEPYGACLKSDGTAVWDWGHQGLNSGAFHPVEGSQIIVAALGAYQLNRLVRSQDNGKTWEQVNGEEQKYAFISFHPQDPNLVFTENRISRDAGVTWEPLPFPSEYITPVIQGLSESQPNTLFATCDYSHRLLRSDDRGQTWYSYFYQNSWQFITLDYAEVFACDPSNPDLIYILHSPSGNILSYDGKSERILDVMSQIPGNLPGNQVTSIAPDPLHPGTLYAGTLFPGLPCLFKTTDYGKTWSDITGTHPMMGMLSSNLKVNPHNGALYQGGPYGTWVFQ